MAREIVGCRRCGWVARPELFEGAAPECLLCSGPLHRMEPAYARRLVLARRRADERRAAIAMAAEVGLEDATRRGP
jgi:hypothetical protein